MKKRFFSIIALVLSFLMIASFLGCVSPTVDNIDSDATESESALQSQEVTEESI